MKLLSIFLGIIFLLGSCKGQPPVWTTTSHWRVYKGSLAFNFSLDTLLTHSNNALIQDSILHYLREVSPYNEKDQPVWMDAWAATYQTPDGKIHKVDISIYAGFFYDETSRTTFILPKAMSASWRSFISSNIPE